MTLASVKDFYSLKKDTVNGGVVNTDVSSYESYQLSKRIATRNLLQQQETQNSVVELQDQINTIKGDLSDIRNMLVQLLQKGN